MVAEWNRSALEGDPSTTAIRVRPSRVALALMQTPAPLPTLPERPLALAVKGSAEDSVPLDYAALPETILTEKGTASALRAELTLPEALEAPVEKGQTVGKVSVFQDDTLLSEYEVKAAADAPLLTFGSALELLWQCLLGA